MSMLSIIIPVYNTPIDKLQRCFESIKYTEELQTEIFVIDDGSDPYIGNFLKEYVKKEERYKYIYQKNAGAGAARNKGLEIANGKYIMFVDSDDTVIPYALDLCDFSSDNDILFFDGILYEHGKAKKWKTFEKSSHDLQRKDVLYAAITGKIFSPCKKLFRTDFLKMNSLSFDIQMVISGEDWKFILETVLCAEKMLYVEKDIYCYWHEVGGIKDRMCRHVEQCLSTKQYSLNFAKEILEQNNEFKDNEKEQILRHLISSYINSLFNMWTSLFILKKLNENIRNELLLEIDKIKLPMGEIASNKIKMKYYLLRHHHWNAMKILAVIRNMYLKYFARMK